MGGALSRIRTALSTSESPNVDVRPLLFLASEVDPRLAKDLVKMAMEGDTIGLDGWRQNLGSIGEGVAAAAAAVSDHGNRRKGLLHLAAAVGDESTCNLLVSIGSHSVTAEIHGVTPLLAAIQGSGSTSIVKLLLDNGAESDISKHDHNGNTPLHIAIEKGLIDIVELLLSNGAQVHLRCETGEMPLHIAARKGSRRMIQLLLEHNADVNVDRPSTALSIAASKGSKDCVDVLLEAGADANLFDENGKLPIEVAALGGWKDCVEKLFPRTNRLPAYQHWTIEEITHLAENEEFWDAMSEFKTVTVGWRSWLDELSLMSVSSKISEKQDSENKGIVSFIHDDLDKIVTVLGPLTILVLAYSHDGKTDGLPSQILKISDAYFHTICCGTMIALPSLALMYGFSAYYKENPNPNSGGFQLISTMLFLANCYLLFVLGVSILGNERAKKESVFIPGAMMILLMALIWPIFLQQPKFFLYWMKALKAKIWKRWERQRLQSTVHGQVQVVIQP